ncbi:hypothetical protein CSCA_1112 [Clostridium scatologenes]|uniref:Uncharacterized protein n=1 Tax=Clostridium scatologenes TaxID=1548 RepID=A0A0E3JXI7_CLOSL|nr:hypothetical protein CSCA_1112 [Clostridium scatologenes]
MFNITIIENLIGIINSTANVIMLYILFKRFLGFKINFITKHFLLMKLLAL